MAIGNKALSSRKRGARAAHKPDATINITPFVDVLLILLVVFMVVSSALPGLNRTANVVVVVRSTNQGEIYMTEEGSLRLLPDVMFQGTRNDIMGYLYDNFTKADNFSFRGEGIVPYLEVEAWAQEIIDHGFTKVKLRFRRHSVPDPTSNAQRL